MSQRMFLASAAGAAVAVGSAAFAQPLIPSTFIGFGGDWGEGENWSAGVPNDNVETRFHAIIDQNFGKPYTVDLDISPLISKFTFTEDDASLDLRSSTLIVNGVSVIRNGTVFGSGRASGALVLQGNTEFGDVRLLSIESIRTSDKLIFDSTVLCDICDTGINHGGKSGVWRSGEIHMGDGSVFTIDQPGALNIESDNTLQWSTGAQPSIFNRGQLVKRNSTGTTFINGPTFENTGVVSVQSGTLMINGVDFGTLGNTLRLGGTWSVIGGGEGPGPSTLRLVELEQADVVVEVNEANVILDGVDSIFPSIQFLRDNKGSFEITNGRAFDAIAEFTNDGVVRVGPGSVMRAPQGLTNFGDGFLVGGSYEITDGGFRAPGLNGLFTLDARVSLTGESAMMADLSGADALDTLAFIGTQGSLELQGGRSITTSTSLQVLQDGGTGTLVVGGGSTYEFINESRLLNIDPQNFELNGGRYVIGGTLMAGGFSQVGILDADVTMMGPGAVFANELGQGVIDPIFRVDDGGALTVTDDFDFQTVADFTVNPSGALTVGDGSLFRVAPGSSLTNFEGGEFNDGTFTIVDTLQFDDAEINHINNVVVLDGSESKIIDQFGQDAFRNLQSLGERGDLTVRAGRDLTAPGDLDTVDGSFVRIGPGVDGDNSVVTVTQDYNQAGGVLELRGGELVVGGTFFVGGSIIGNGVINGQVVNQGVIGPGLSPGRLTVIGSVTHEVGSVLVMELAGDRAGSGYDVLDIDGPMSFAGDLAGTLAVRVLPSATFSPVEGQVFDLVYFTSLTGWFDKVEVSGMPAGLDLKINILDDRVRGRVVPAPSGALLALAGLAGCLGRRRR